MSRRVFQLAAVRSALLSARVETSCRVRSSNLNRFGEGDSPPTESRKQFPATSA